MIVGPLGLRDNVVAALWRFCRTQPVRLARAGPMIRPMNRPAVKPRKQNILLTGRPGIGKTTAIMRTAEILGGRPGSCGSRSAAAAIRSIAGFFTEEIRKSRLRVGFRAVTFGGPSCILAHLDIPGPHRVGRYGVDVAAFERIVLPELARPADLMVIDEIGKMECYSNRFIDSVRGLLEGPRPVVATIALQGGGFIAEAKSRADVEILEVTRESRDGLPALLVEKLLRISEG